MGPVTYLAFPSGALTDWLFVIREAQVRGLFRLLSFSLRQGLLSAALRALLHGDVLYCIIDMCSSWVSKNSDTLVCCSLHPARDDLRSTTRQGPPAAEAGLPQRFVLRRALEVGQPLCDCSFLADPQQEVFNHIFLCFFSFWFLLFLSFCLPFLSCFARLSFLS